MTKKAKVGGSTHARKAVQPVRVPEMNESKESSHEKQRPEKEYEKPKKQFDEWASFSSAEKWFYIIAWICACGYSVYRTWLVSYEKMQDMSPYSFTRGWSIIGPWRDGSNFEWEFWSRQFPLVFAILGGHVIVGQVVRFISFEHRSYLFLAYGMATFSYLTNIWSVLLLIGHCVIAYSVAWFGSHLLTWIAVILLVETLNHEQCSVWMAWLCGSRKGDQFYYLMVFVVSMCSLRYASFCSEWCMVRAEQRSKSKSGSNPKEKEEKMPSSPSTGASGLSFRFLDLLIYVFYIPFLFYGPMVIYKDFHQQLHAPMRAHSKRFLVHLFLDFLRVCFWVAFAEILLHFLYFNAIANEQIMPLTISRWALVGSAYLLGQFFQVKYVIYWGLPGVFGQLDQIEIPPVPRCVATIHIYSNMWKYFDNGLYRFFMRHIYIPLGGSRHGIVRQVFASLCCFAFVAFWHGGEKYLIYWVTLNFIGITLETMGTLIYHQPTVTKWRNTWLSGRMQRRIFAAFATPLLIMNTLAIFTFLGGLEFGYIVYQRAIFEDWPVSALWAYACVYCWTQTGIEVDQWQRRRKIKVD